MGAVYLAEDTRLGREVALKTMHAELMAKPGAKERFLREARLAAALEHDHIVPIYHVGEADGTPDLAMPFLKGQSLDDVLKARNTLSNEQLIRLGIQVARGLAAAHAHGLIHRDIKPLNVMVGELGEVQVMDWGLAKELTSRDRQGAGDETNAAPLPGGRGSPEQTADETNAAPLPGGRGSLEQTAAGTVMGTPGYMAPEQARGEKLDGRADLYSLGAAEPKWNPHRLNRPRRASAARHVAGLSWPPAFSASPPC
jgi:serine/threonine protein kinase